MATEKQIAANRANAKRSSGPKTAAGKQRSSRNAFRHGLSGPLPDDALTMAATGAIVSVLSNSFGEQDENTMAFAQAQVQLSRIRKVRNGMFDALMSGTVESRKLRRLMALDRYERVARTESRRTKQLMTEARVPKAGK
jgi:hypothetical protein